MKKLLFIKILSILLIDVFPIKSFCQYYSSQNKVWAFGTNVGLNFNSGSPVAFTSAINTYEGCASVSDSLGNLLFYTNGKSVYNSLGNLMPSGYNIVSFITNSTEQAALVIPVIGSNSRYYIFSLESLNGSILGNCHLAYSIVDMSLNGGLGDVVVSSISTALGDSLGENMIAIAGNNYDIWLVTHKRDTALFISYDITVTGISMPVISPVGEFTGYECYGRSMLKVSPNRRRIGQAVFNVYQRNGNELFDFDPNTGLVSNEILLDTVGNDYGVEFSPDNTKIYFGSNASGSVIQYDISLSSTTAMKASAFIVTDSAGIGDDLRLAPNGIIYFAGQANNISCISNPNVAGAACRYIANAITLATGSLAQEGLPNLFVTTDTVNRVGVYEFSNHRNVAVYPNPVHDEITIVSPEKICLIYIVNLLGQMVYTQACNNKEIQVNVASFPTGVYFIKINGPDSYQEIRKFVKE